MFLCTDKPGEIVRLVEDWPEFRPLYETVYNVCRNTEKVMGFFSEELRELDRNTVQYMMDEMQDEIDGLRFREQQINLLNQRLIEGNRIEDLRRSAQDRDYQKQLLKEYGI